MNVELKLDSKKVPLSMIANNKISTNVLAGASDYPVGEFAYILTCYLNMTIHNPQTSFKCIF